MSLTSGVVNNPAIDNLVQSSLESENEHLRLKWIPCSEITDITSSPMDSVYYASRYRVKIMVLSLGIGEECTPTFVSEFARIYSLPTHKHDSNRNDFKRYSLWLEKRNRLIKGFTKDDDKYYIVAKRQFYHYYSGYGFCSACGILRCSPVWCICGHKQLSDGWTSNNNQLDDFIKNSQLQTNSPNHAYLEWIPFDCTYDWDDWVGRGYYSLPAYADVTLIPLEITDETHDLYYAEVNYLLMRHVY